MADLPRPFQDFPMTQIENRNQPNSADINLETYQFTGQNGESLTLERETNTQTGVINEIVNMANPDTGMRDLVSVYNKTPSMGTTCVNLYKGTDMLQLLQRKNGEQIYRNVPNDITKQEFEQNLDGHPITSIDPNYIEKLKESPEWQNSQPLASAASSNPNDPKEIAKREAEKEKENLAKHIISTHKYVETSQDNKPTGIEFSVIEDNNKITGVKTTSFELNGRELPLPIAEDLLEAMREHGILYQRNGGKSAIHANDERTATIANVTSFVHGLDKLVPPKSPSGNFIARN